MRSSILILCLFILFPVQNFGQEISSNNNSKDLINFLIPNLILRIKPNDNFQKKYMGYYLVLKISEDKNILVGKVEDHNEFLLSEIDKDLLEKVNKKFKGLDIEFEANCLYIYPILVVISDSYYEVEDNFEEGILSAFPSSKFTDFECVITEKVTIVKRSINT